MLLRGKANIDYSSFNCPIVSKKKVSTVPKPDETDT